MTWPFQKGRSNFHLRPLSEAASAHLDAIRALAAAAVMWGHLRTIFFIDFEQLAGQNVVVKGIYFLTGFGHQAVMVFFVLSGFLISASVIKGRMAGGWSWREYAINRLARLYAVLIPGLLLGFFFDKLGSSIFASTGLYQHPLENLGPGIAAARITAANFFGNLFFLQTIVCPTFGSNGPLWSLANEFWYYVLFPVTLSAILLYRQRRFGSAILLMILSVDVVAFLGAEKLLGFLIWMTGCAVVIAYSRFRLSGWALIYFEFTACLALGACLVAARTGNLGLVGSDLAVGIAFAFLLYGALVVEFGGSNRIYTNLARIFAGFSYSLYVLHFPVLLFLRAWLVPSQRWLPDMKHLLCGAVIGAVVLAFAWFISSVTENKTRLLRDWMKDCMGGH